MIQNFQDLMVWKKAHQLALDIYAITQQFPQNEMYGITSQIRRAAVSVSANIAEGSKRRTTKDLLHFLNIASGSNEELKALLFLSRDLQFLEKGVAIKLLGISDEIGAMLFSLSRSLKS